MLGFQKDGEQNSSWIQLQINMLTHCPAKNLFTRFLTIVKKLFLQCWSNQISVNPQITSHLSPLLTTPSSVYSSFVLGKNVKINFEHTTKVTTKVRGIFLSKPRNGPMGNRLSCWFCIQDFLTINQWIYQLYNYN